MNTREYRNQMINRLLASESGIKALGNSLIQPLRKFQDYQSIGRNAVLVETLKQGQDPLVDLDVEGNLAYSVANLGADIVKIVNPDTTRIQTQEIASNPSISYTQIASRKFDLQARVEQKATSEIFRVEDRIIFQGLLAVATHKYTPLALSIDDAGNRVVQGTGKEVSLKGNPVNAPVVKNRADVGLAEFSAAMAQVESHGGLKATNVFMNPYDTTILRNINVNNTNGYFVDFETSQEIIRTGRIGNVYGMKVFVSPEIPKGTIIVTADAEFVGRLVERIPLNVIPYDNPQKRAFEFSIFEDIGIIFHNPAAVCAIQIK